jgi:hypothetical protein
MHRQMNLLDEKLALTPSPAALNPNIVDVFAQSAEVGPCPNLT